MKNDNIYLNILIFLYKKENRAKSTEVTHLFSDKYDDFEIHRILGSMLQNKYIFIETINGENDTLKFYATIRQDGIDKITSYRDLKRNKWVGLGTFIILIITFYLVHISGCNKGNVKNDSPTNKEVKQKKVP